MSTTTPKLTIGMATHEDAYGVYFTLQSLILNLMYTDSELLKQIEFVVVDNSPETDTRTGRPSQHIVNIQNLVQNIHKQKYVKFNHVQSTSRTRQEIFNQASGDFVLVLDCHVLLPPTAIKQLVAFYDENPETNDLYQGPLLFDDGKGFATHFAPKWRAEMYGFWATAWTCPCEELNFGIWQEGDLAVPKHLMSNTPLTKCGRCSFEFPKETPWHGHEAVYSQAGCRPLATRGSDQPFEIPGQGLGLFTCRREAWLGFHPEHRGFGGEELYIHEKFRQAGHRAMCLPWLKWMHRFMRVDGVTYPLTKFDKVRNYVLEYQELGKDVQEIYEHFVNESNSPLKQEEWDLIIKDPVAAIEQDVASCGSCGSSGPNLPVEDVTDLAEVFDTVKANPRDLNEHMDYLAELATKCVKIVDISDRRESAIALMYGLSNAEPDGASEIRLFNSERTDPFLKSTVEHQRDQGNFKVGWSYSSRTVPDIMEDTDLLFLDGEHTYTAVLDQLTRFAPKVNRYIVLHDTESFRDNGEDGGPGLVKAMRAFLQDPQFSEWTVIAHNPNQYGLTTLGRLPEDKPKLPSKLDMAGHLAKDMLAWAKDGGRTTTDEEFEARLAICDVCPVRTLDSQKTSRCSACGCPVAKRAMVRTLDCVLGKWPQLEEVAAEGGETNDNV